MIVSISLVSKEGLVASAMGMPRVGQMRGTGRMRWMR